MKDFRSAAQQYLADKGCKSNGQKYTAFEIVKMLNEFAQEQVKNCSIPDDVGQSEQLPCDCQKYLTYFDKENKPRCKNCNKRSWLAR